MHADKAGQLLILQISKQLLPTVQQGDLDLTGTITFEMALTESEPEF